MIARLQALFISEAVTRVQAEFKYEGIEFDQAAFKNNAAVVELLDGKVSVLTLLNSQSVANTLPDDRRFVQELHNHFGGGKHPDYKMPPSGVTSHFTIRHFAAEVTYTAADGPGGRGVRLPQQGHAAAEAAAADAHQPLAVPREPLPRARRPQGLDAPAGGPAVPTGGARVPLAGARPK